MLSDLVLFKDLDVSGYKGLRDSICLFLDRKFFSMFGVGRYSIIKKRKVCFDDINNIGSVICLKFDKELYYDVMDLLCVIGDIVYIFRDSLVFGDKYIRLDLSIHFNIDYDKVKLALDCFVYDNVESRGLYSSILEYNKCMKSIYYNMVGYLTNDFKDAYRIYKYMRMFYCCFYDGKYMVNIGDSIEDYGYYLKRVCFGINILNRKSVRYYSKYIRDIYGIYDNIFEICDACIYDNEHKCFSELSDFKLIKLKNDDIDLLYMFIGLLRMEGKYNE